jgi:nicotinamidase-related amidase
MVHHGGEAHQRASPYRFGAPACRTCRRGYYALVSEVALLVIDMLNAYQHEDADSLAENVAAIVEPLSGLIERANEHPGVDVVYVNDNYGDFSATTADIVRAALAGRRPELVEPVVPRDDSMVLTKVRHSAFYASPLAYLLRRLETSTIILTGQVTEQCILYTALDGYVRHFDVVVPSDAVAHIDAELGRAALRMMEDNMRAEIRSSADCLP